MSKQLPPLTTCIVAVIGLGYVGLPLAVEFAKSLNRRVIGFEINQQRLIELCAHHGRTKEISPRKLRAAQLLEFTVDTTHFDAADV